MGRDADVTADEIYSAAVDAMNDPGRYKGPSPCEMMLGRTPEPTVGDASSEGHDVPMMRKTACAGGARTIR